MKFSNIIGLTAGFISVVAAEWFQGVEVPKEFITDYSRYYNCKDVTHCKYLCNKAVRECWNSKKYQSKECWNLETACEAIDSGAVPTAKKEFESTYKVNVKDPKNAVGIKIPSNLLLYISQPADDNNAKMNAGRTCFNTFNAECIPDVENEMTKTIDVEGYSLTKIQYCAIFAEVCQNIDTYTTTSEAVSEPTTSAIPEPTETVLDEPTNNEEPPYKCMAELAGYPCCPEQYTYVYETDPFGDWSFDFENQTWCGLTPYFDPHDMDGCWSEIYGYKCCQQCGYIYEIDDSGRWGYEDDWCGMPLYC